MRKKINKTIYLHIGRHKTGTSSIQNFINAYPEVLGKYSLYYPETGRQGIAHHNFANAFSYSATRTDREKQIAVESEMVSALRREIDEQDSDILVSSEAFQNANPKLVAEVFSGYKIKTLVYIRNQIDYLASAYAQKVWATDYSDSIEQYYEHNFRGNYDTFLSSWDEVSDAGISVSVFSRKELFHSDIVADFFKRMLEIDDKNLINKILTRSIVDSNPSLTCELLAYKLAFNSHKYNVREKMRKKFMGVLGLLSLRKDGTPVRVSERMAESCRSLYKEVNESVSEKYFQGKMSMNMNPRTGENIELGYDLASKITADLISVDQTLEIILKTFMDDEFPMEHVA